MDRSQRRGRSFPQAQREEWVIDWKHYVLALPIALFLLFLAFSFAGDTSEIMAEDETVAAQGLIEPTEVDGYRNDADCDEDSSDENGDEDGESSEDEGDEDSESEDGDEDSCDEGDEGEDGDED
jgi:hypothetical protein